MDPKQAAAAAPISYWIYFSIGVLVLLVLDLSVFHRKAHRISAREALAWTGFWVSLAAGFNLWVFYRFGSLKAQEFLTGYLMEEALSVDNIFVFVLIFRYFRVKPEYQHRILFWGILGAIVMRLLFILIGGALIKAFHPVLYVFGAFLLFTGFKLLTHKDEIEVDPSRNWALRVFKRHFRTTEEFQGPRFLVKRDGLTYATPLFLVLVVVETTDVVFAVDSVPAIFGVTEDTFIVFTSNIFAILGLRSIYFLLAGMMDAFRFLKVGLSLVLIFIGIKMLAEIFGEEYKVSITVSLGVVAGILVTSILASIFRPPPPPPPLPEENGNGPPSGTPSVAE